MNNEKAVKPAFFIVFFTRCNGSNSKKPYKPIHVGDWGNRGNPYIYSPDVPIPP